MIHYIPIPAPIGDIELPVGELLPGCTLNSIEIACMTDDQWYFIIDADGFLPESLRPENVT